MPLQEIAGREPGGAEESQQWAQHLETFLKPFLERLDAYLDRRVVVRGKKGQKLVDATGQERKAWEIARGKRVGGERKPLWDTPARVSRSTGVLALPVRHAQYPGDLFLVVVRQGKGRDPWDLLTNASVETAEQAWEVVDASARAGALRNTFASTHTNGTSRPFAGRRRKRNANC